jgi:hypothetical protein
MNYVLEPRAKGLIDELASFPFPYEASPAAARSVVESVQASTTGPPTRFEGIDGQRAAAGG